jgi:ankyrin repeat protein
MYRADAVRYLAAAANRNHSVGPVRRGVNAPGVDGRTCLHIAAMTNNIALVTFLIDNDANKEATVTCQVALYSMIEFCVHV